MQKKIDRILEKYTRGEQWAILLIVLPPCMLPLSYILNIFPLLNQLSFLQDIVILLFTLSFTIVPISSLLITIWLKTRDKKYLRTMLLLLSIIENLIIVFYLFTNVLPIAGDYS